MRYHTINMECEESQCNSKKLENRPISYDIQYIMKWKINLFYKLIIIEERFCIRQIKKIATVFTYSNISHKQISSKTCILSTKNIKSKTEKYNNQEVNYP